MFIDFNPLLLIFWIFVTSFIPGVLLFLGLFKDYKRLNLLEKILCGFAIGFIIPSFIPFLLFLFLGIKYTYIIAILSVVLFYIAAIIVFVKNKAYEEFVGLKLPDFSSPTLSSISSHATAIFLVAILFLTFWIRVQSSSPIFYEFDPYFYLYSAQQLLVFGENPFQDKTAWYPEILNNHRVATPEVYMESIWYSFYTNGGEYSNYLLVLIAGYYPPIAAAFTVFFLYLFVSINYRREHALLGATLMSFVPITLAKFSAGEMESQPYGFFMLAMFIAFYALSIQDKKIKFAVLASLAYIGLFLGASSSVVIATMILLFVPFYGLILFLKDKDSEGLKSFLIINVVILILGFLLSSFLGSIFHYGDWSGLTDRSDGLFNSKFKAYLLVTLITALLYVIKEKVNDAETRAYILIGLGIIGLTIFTFTPLANSIKEIAGTTGLAAYTTTLQRTIAEQGTTGGFFEGQMGYFATKFNNILDLTLIPFSFISNSIFTFMAKASETVSGNDIGFDAPDIVGWLVAQVSSALGNPNTNFDNKDWKPPSILMTFLGLFCLATAYAFYRFVKGEKNIALLYVTLILPIAFIGIIKAKFTIYIAILFVGLIGMILGEMEKILKALIKKLDLKEKELLKLPIYLSLAIGIALVYMQYTSNPDITALISSSFTPKFQDNPLALQNRLATVCSQLKLQGAIDDDICAAAADPIGYASKGTNYQYNPTLCVLSHYSNPFAPTPSEQTAASYRCRNMNNYWVETMEWIRYNTENDSRTTSWWDYGHWINFFGQKNAVLRNEQSSLPMILEVAHDYIDGTPEDLAQFMKAHYSKYVLFDSELLFNGNSFGGKYGALNYLSCVRNNETNVSMGPGSSLCESNHLWEIIYVPSQNQEPCEISKNMTGIVSYKIEYLQTANGLTTQSKKEYCIGQTKLIDGRDTTATFYMNQKYANGDLKLNKAFLKPEGQTNDGFSAFSLLYTHDKIWIENGEIKDGFEDRKGKFYDSNLYNAFLLEDLPGFDLVFKSNGGEVKIYKLKE
ncbi:MAG: hypothetical protein Q7S22_03250 [Candidatus Micrarchaeota archaeon]|nr:hypothetical protein [Candidatus Micrarchaeota archaeon]